MTWMLATVLVFSLMGFGCGFMAGARVWGYTRTLHDLDDDDIVKLRNFYARELVQRRKARDGMLGK